MLWLISLTSQTLRGFVCWWLRVRGSGGMFLWNCSCTELLLYRVPVVWQFQIHLTGSTAQMATFDA
jgi:hypothetical protein